MVATEQQAPGRATLAQRWLARLALVATAGAVLVRLVAAGFRASLALVGRAGRHGAWPPPACGGR